MFLLVTTQLYIGQPAGHRRRQVLPAAAGGWLATLARALPGKIASYRDHEYLLLKVQKATATRRLHQVA